MKAEQKKTIWQMLKAASAAVEGFNAREFSQEQEFFDDSEAATSMASGQFAPAPQSFAQGQNSAQSGGSLQNNNLSQGQDSDPQFAAGATIESIAQKIAACSRCPLSQQRKNVVPGEGVSQPLVLVVGEGPGADEDEQGRPFVGRAGQLLDKMLGAIGLSRGKNCFIANVVKCRPPMNRDPAPQEAAACRSFLDAQIHVLKPKMVLAMGRVALQNLLDTSIGINRLRGQIMDFKGIPFMATYHPSALLRDESLKRPAWEDLKTFRQKLLEICPDYDK